MKVKRIVADMATDNLAAAMSFYQDVLGLSLLMDQGWIATYGSEEMMNVQISFASQGGSGAPIPDLSIEVDDVDTAFNRMREFGFQIEYGPVNEPWGVRRFFVRDPFGKLVNILMHKPLGDE
ncbi:MAG: glyoxalase [Edaphobacter sp.]|nr:glyoxalase [Edaphobacter sp.]